MSYRKKCKQTEPSQFFFYSFFPSENVFRTKPAPDMLPRMAGLAVKPPTTVPTTIRAVDVIFNRIFSFLKCL